MKINWKIIQIVFVIGVICLCIGMCSRNNSLTSELSISKNNEKALLLNNDSIKTSNRMLALTIDQLNYYSDSILIKMNEVRKELDIKDDEITQLHYILSDATTVDTILIKDTIFKNPDFCLDTILKDEWYKLNMVLKYPNLITASPSFKSEKYVFVNYKEETVDPPKKWWICRVFQKKHKIIEVNIEEKSPYIKIKDSKFVKIINDE